MFSMWHSPHGNVTLPVCPTLCLPDSSLPMEASMWHSTDGVLVSLLVSSCLFRWMRSKWSASVFWYIGSISRFILATISLVVSTFVISSVSLNRWQSTERCQKTIKVKLFSVANIIWAILVERMQVSLTCLLWKAAYKSQARFCPGLRGKGGIKRNRWAQVESGAKNWQRGAKLRKVWNIHVKIYFCVKRLVMWSAVKKREESKSSKKCTMCIKADGQKSGQELMTRSVNCATRCFVPDDKN